MIEEAACGPASEEPVARLLAQAEKTGQDHESASGADAQEPCQEEGSPGAAEEKDSAHIGAAILLKGWQRLRRYLLVAEARQPRQPDRHQDGPRRRAEPRRGAVGRRRQKQRGIRKEEEVERGAGAPSALWLAVSKEVLLQARGQQNGGSTESNDG